MRKCRIMYIPPVSSGKQAKQSSLYKLTGLTILAVILAIGFVVYMWAFIWFLCALDDVCFAANTIGGLA